MSTSTLQLMPSSADSTQTDLVAYDLKRLKVYSSCLRCRAKKVKCDRKEPCSRCKKHAVECSYREMASVQLDIRQFHRHLTNPRVRRDGAGLITATATPVIPPSAAGSSSSSSSSSPSSSSTAASSSSPVTSTSTSPSTSTTSRNNTGHSRSSNSINISISTSSNISLNCNSNTIVSPTRTRPQPPLPNARNSYECPTPGACAALYSPTEPEAKAAAPSPIESSPEHGRILKVHGRRSSIKSQSKDDRMGATMRDISEHVDRVQLTESITTTATNCTTMAAPAHLVSGPAGYEHDHRRRSGLPPPPHHPPHEDEIEDVPIWKAQAVGKHKQTAHEQDMAEAFGLAAYLKAKEEMETLQDPGQARQTIDYEMELERALAQRMPSFYSRHDKSSLRVRSSKHASGYTPASTPYARPSHCQLSSPPSNGSSSSTHGCSSNKHTMQHPPASAQCCCQIAAMQGQTLSACPYSSNSNNNNNNNNSNTDMSYTTPTAAYERPTPPTLSPTASPVSTCSASPHSLPLDHEDTPRIAYSPSLRPRYIHGDGLSGSSESFMLPQIKTFGWPLSSSSSTMYPPALTTSTTTATTTPTSPFSLSSKMDMAVSPTLRLPPIRVFEQKEQQRSICEVGRDAGVDEHMQIECKFNEPNVDAWDMIEKPISRTVPLKTKRGRSIKMEMKWILS